MRLEKRMVMLLLLSCLLCCAACLGRQVEDGAAISVVGSDSQNTQAQPETETKEFIHGWTFPDAAPKGKPSGKAINKENRDRMMTDETDQYIRAWTFPTSSAETQKKPATTSKPIQLKPNDLPVSNTEDFVNGWTFE